MGVPVTALAKEIEKCLEEYTGEVELALEETKKELASTAVKELKTKSPKNTGEYAKRWTKKKRGKKIIVHNKIYQLTHLLEKGHAKVGGGRVEARVHIAPVEKQLQDDAEAVFRKKLK